MINEIKRRLKSGETICLECIDRESYLSGDINDVRQRILNCDSIVAVGCGFVGVLLNKGNYRIPYDALKYFKIKESKKTFHDLVDVAVQAKKDGVVYSVDWDSSLTVKVDSHRAPIVIACEKVSGDFIEDAIRSIKSCYTETFTIESEEDISKVKSGAEVVLANGSRGIAESQHCHLGESFLHVVSGDYSTYLYLFSLKGATVTQKKTNN